MQVFILDPDLTAGATKPNPNNPSQRPPQQLPPSVREFGFIPDCSLWRPGDLLLFSAVRRDRWQHRIVAAQAKLNYAAVHAQWHHVAVYIGERYICEARPGGTRYHPVDDLVVGHRIRVRRGTKVSTDDGYRVAIHAMMRLRMPYDYRSVVWSLIQTFPGRWDLAQPFGDTYPRQAVNCAKLFHDAYWEVTKRILVQRADSGVVPAELSGCSGLSDVQSQWLRLP